MQNYIANKINRPKQTMQTLDRLTDRMTDLKLTPNTYVLATTLNDAVATYIFYF